MESADDLRLVLTTWPADRPADEMASALVGDGLAACVSVLAPMTSYYRWDGALEQAEERQVLIKTTAARLPALEARLRALHPYELPELLVLDAAASTTYGAWVAAAVAPRASR
ncbi:MAG: divalent-cation tolerance protein CutA [Vicinamibacterales bacterium]